MAKRHTVEVDEEYLREVMAGGAVSHRKEEPVKQVNQPPPASTTENPVKKEPEEPAEMEKAAKPGRKKRELQAYEEVFLQRKASVPRRQTYISIEIYDKILRFLPVLTRGMSVTAYIDNVLAHHLDLYKDEINEMYYIKTQKPL